MAVHEGQTHRPRSLCAMVKTATDPGRYRRNAGPGLSPPPGRVNGALSERIVLGGCRAAPPGRAGARGGARAGVERPHGSVPSVVPDGEAGLRNLFRRLYLRVLFHLIFLAVELSRCTFVVSLRIPYRAGERRGTSGGKAALNRGAGGAHGSERRQRRVRQASRFMTFPLETTERGAYRTGRGLSTSAPSLRDGSEPGRVRQRGRRRCRSGRAGPRSRLCRQTDEVAAGARHLLSTRTDA